jgi:hypothetical protein
MPGPAPDTRVDTAGTGAPAVPVPDAVATVDDLTAEPDHAPEHAPDDPGAPQRYTVRHYTVLALVALVLGFVVWSLVNGAAQSGATGAAPAPPTTSPIGPPTAHPGVL